jgi:hypothetical protein
MLSEASNAADEMDIGVKRPSHANRRRSMENLNLVKMTPEKHQVSDALLLYLCMNIQTNIPTR